MASLCHRAIQTRPRTSPLSFHLQPPPLFCDFLAPRLITAQDGRRRIHNRAQIRSASTNQSTRHASTAAFPPPASSARAQPTTLSPAQRAYLDSALRVNQAGELAATLIYAAQTPLLVNRHPSLRPLMKHMYEQEVGHFSTFNALLAKHRVRPTAMYPVWSAAASFLGWGTGLMGREAAMACTEAVETEIGEHYNNQVRELLAWSREAEGRGEKLNAEFTELVETLKRIRDEELEHLDHAVENDAKEARPYDALTNVIRLGCRGAIWVSERV